MVTFIFMSRCLNLKLWVPYSHLSRVTKDTTVKRRNFFFFCAHKIHLMYNLFCTRLAKGHVRYIDILKWPRRFRVKKVNCSNSFCLTIPKTDLDTKKTPPNREVCPESLGIAMFEYSYIEGGLFIHIQTSRSKIITEIVTRMLILSTRFMQHNTVKRNWALLWGLYFRGDVNHNCSHRASRNDALSLQGLSKVCLFSQMS